MKDNKLFYIYLAGYFFIRIFSFFWQPGTVINNILSIILISAVVYGILLKKDWSVALICSELFLGGSGMFLQLYSISSRTIILCLSILLFFFQNISSFFKNRSALIILSLYLLGFFAALNGYLNGNAKTSILADLIPYIFFGYYFYINKYWSNKNIQRIITPLIFATITGGFFFILFTLFGFSSKIFILQDSYYHWFRDIAGGKITFVEFNFYRLVLNEHLLLAPGLIAIFFKYLETKSEKYLTLAAMLLGTLAINLTRIYFLAAVFPILLFITKRNFKDWLLVSLKFLTIFAVIFSSIFLVSSSGKSFGFEVFGLRLQSIVMPSIENSSLSRMLLLPKILDLIKSAPIFGKGLGTTISVYSPIFKEAITTPHFDWGYLEMIAELGMVGFIIYLSSVVYIFIKLKKQSIFLIAILLSILIINITSPALFHVFGVLVLSLLLAAATNHTSQAPASSPLRTS